MLAGEQHCHACNRETMHHDRKCVECAGHEAQMRETIWKAKTPTEKIEELRKRIGEVEDRLNARF